MLQISASAFLIPFSYNIIIIIVVVANVMWSQPSDQLCYQYQHHDFLFPSVTTSSSSSLLLLPMSCDLNHVASYVTNISITISPFQLQHHHQRCCCQCLVISTTWPAMLPIFSSPCIFLSTISSSSAAAPTITTITLSKTYLLLLDSRHPTVMVWHYRN